MAMTLGEAIRTVRGPVGQVELARLLADKSVDQSRISKWERGQGAPNIEQIRSIERALGVAVGSILRLAGYVEDLATARDAIESDPLLPSAHRPTVLRIYDALATIPATDPSPSGSKRARIASARPKA